MRHTNATQRPGAGITPPLFTFLDAQPNGASPIRSVIA